MNEEMMHAAGFPAEKDSDESLSLNDLLSSLFNSGDDTTAVEGEAKEVEGEATEVLAEDESDADPAETEEEDADSESLFMEVLRKMSEAADDDEDDDEDDDGDDDDSGMDADDYHNKAVDYARRNQYKKAAAICMEGLKRYPVNVDLIADTIKYSAMAGDIDTADSHYALLKKKIPLQRWNWRAFTFSFDYLLEKDPAANEQECRSIVAAYKTCLPYEEKACMAESDLEEALGNREKSLQVLQEAVQSRTNASQCALHLADKQLEAGRFEEVIETANYAIAASAEPQPSINVPYACFLRALAQDHMLHRKAMMHKCLFKAEVEEMIHEYEKLLKLFPNLLRHADTIQLRIQLLKLIRTV